MFSLIRWFFGVIFVITTLILFAPILLRLYGDVILTKMFFQSWCKYRQTFILFLY